MLLYLCNAFLCNPTISPSRHHVDISSNHDGGFDLCRWLWAVTPSLATASFLYHWYYAIITCLSYRIAGLKELCMEHFLPKMRMDDASSLSFRCLFDARLHCKMIIDTLTFVMMRQPVLVVVSVQPLLWHVACSIIELLFSHLDLYQTL